MRALAKFPRGTRHAWERVSLLWARGGLEKPEGTIQTDALRPVDTVVSVPASVASGTFGADVKALYQSFVIALSALRARRPDKPFVARAIVIGKTARWRRGEVRARNALCACAQLVGE